MSYEILYGQQFVDLGEGRVLPLILSGSNNCTMYHGGREIRERNWWCFGPDGPCSTKDGLMKWIEESAAEKPDNEWFLRGGKWMLGSNMVKWMENSIKSARTIEDILHILPYQSLTCYVQVYDKTKSYSEAGYSKQIERAYPKTTEEIRAWIEKFKRIKEEKGEKEEIYASIEFSGIEPLKLGKKSASADGPVVCKQKGRYLSEYKKTIHGYTYTFSHDIAEAITFENEEDFREKTKELHLSNYRLVKAQQPQRNFVIKVHGGTRDGYYVEKISTRHLFFTRTSKSGRRFASAGEAMTYIAERLEGRFPSCGRFVVEKIEEESA